MLSHPVPGLQVFRAQQGEEMDESEALKMIGNKLFLCSKLDRNGCLPIHLALRSTKVFCSLQRRTFKAR